MSFNYLESFRSYRDEFKQFQQQHQPLDEMADSIRDEFWLQVVRDSPCDLQLTPRKLSSSGQQVNPILIHGAASSSKSGVESIHHFTEEHVHARDSASAMESGSRNPKGINNSSRSSSELDTSRNNRSRKGHKKSRQGCYSCKKRKIKVTFLLTHCHSLAAELG